MVTLTHLNRARARVGGVYVVVVDQALTRASGITEEQVYDAVVAR